MSKQNTGRKFFATAATAALVASAIVPVASAAEFTDADQIASWAKEAVEALAAKEVITGNPDGSFNPAGTVTRAQAAKMFTVALGLDTEGTENFADVKDGQWFQEYVVAVVNAGIVNGMTATEFAPNGKLTREQAAKMIVEAYGLEGEADLSKFADAKSVSGKWSEGYLSTAVANGVINGKGDKLAATDSISRQEFAVMLTRAIDAGTDNSAELLAAVEEATKALDEAVKALKTEVKVEEIEAAKAGVTTAETAIVTVETALEAAKEVVSEEQAAKVNEAIASAKKAVETTKAAIAKAEEAAKDLNVESVTAINGSTIQVKFTKAVKKETVIDTNGDVDADFTLVEDTATATPVTLTGKKAELSEDGKTLNVYVASNLEGNYVLKIAKDVVLTADGKKALPEVKAKFSIKDTTRAAIEGVKNESKYVFNINLTEPVTSTGNVTATLADGTSVISGATTLTNNGKTLQVTLVNNNNAVNAGKEVTVTIPSLTDFAGNISVPTTQTVTVSNSDVTAPKVVSTVATSATSVEVTFDEAVTLDTTVTAGNFDKFKFNGSQANTVISSIAPKAGDTTKTKFVVTLASAQTTAAYLDLLAGAATDLSGNTLEATSKLVTFNTDKTAPTVTSTSVQKIAGVNYLVVNFSEKVSKVGNTALAFKFKDEFGVEQTATLAAGNIAADVTPNGTDGTSFKINLTNVSPALKTGVEYSVEFAKGYFKDAFSNDLEKTTVKFVNNSSDATTTKLVATIGAEGVDADGRYVTVNFDKTVDPASATDKANYTVEGATVKEVKLASNTAASGSVKVYLTADTVKLTGNYQVTVQNVKGFNSSIKAIDSTTASVVIKENVAAKVKSKSITFGANSVIDLTFDENVTVATGTDFDLYIDGVKSTATVATAQNGTTGVRVTVTGLDLSSDIASTKKVVLKANGTFDIEDDNDNIASTLDVTLN
ncbi:S-layer homology domain-containing protein [Solibacillus sp. MA9]|uniref:S-layer homology domain-containing protein n=1 Tax=Solibacillus palustris TaxID=2908203 RepID=A0ABS9U8F1_9BACL|nr:S-layer homology domain-containing protein [Solibacillus sp. MA9]MCH7320617.1 S-layer homology domain-containing protein [Solibacillus sp. MA9]